MQVVPSGPDVIDDELFAGILSFLFSAKHRLWSQPLFPAQRDVGRSAADRPAARRRRADRGSGDTDQRLVDLARGQFLRDLCALNCKVLLYTPGMVHAKAMLVDDVAAAVGSTNFDSRSMFLNFKVSSVIH